MIRDFEYGNIKARLFTPYGDTFMNQARFTVRLTKRLTDEQLHSQAGIQGIPAFTTVLAHIAGADNFPFDLPSPFAHPDDVYAAWQAYLDIDPAFWQALFLAIGPLPYIPDVAMYFTRALIEYEDMEKRGEIPPPKGKHRE